VSHVLEGRRGDNPYCYYRATTLAKRGLRETIAKVQDAPDQPFATGRFEIRLERSDGSRAPRSLGLDDKARKRGRLILCGSCHQYIYAKERACPHCGGENRPVVMVEQQAALEVRNTIEAIERHGRRILEIAGMAAKQP
jgi:hypothetical protein